MTYAVFMGMLIPLIFLIILLKGENRKMMLFFTWGMVAFVLSLAASNVLAARLQMSVFQLSVTWAPVIEEILKSLPLLYFLFRRKNTEYPLVYFAMAAGIGFSIQENYLYLMSYTGLGGSVTFYMILRSITACLMHGVTTAVIGYGLTLIRKYEIMVAPLLFGLFSVVIILHALFNLYINSSVKLIGMLIPVLLYIAGLVILYLQKDPEPSGKEQG